MKAIRVASFLPLEELHCSDIRLDQIFSALQAPIN